MANNVYKFFDRLEDRVREFLSHYPILYAVIGGTGTILIWRGVWHTADFLSARYFHPSSFSMGPSGGEAWEAVGAATAIEGPFLWDGFVSLLLGTVILLVTGLLVSNFIGEHIIISGLKHEKKLTEKTEEEVEEEANVLTEIRGELKKMNARLEALEKTANRNQ